jgi:hypothetical protein
MELILTIIMLILMAAGYILMDRLDTFLASDKIIKAVSQEDTQSILVYKGDTDLSMILETVDDRDKSLVFAKDYEDYELRGCKAIVAISDNDADNLMLCVKAKHTKTGITTIARCNNNLNLEIFREAGVTKIVTTITMMDSIRQLLKESDKNA